MPTRAPLESRSSVWNVRVWTSTTTTRAISRRPTPRVPPRTRPSTTARPRLRSRRDRRRIRVEAPPQSRVSPPPPWTPSPAKTATPPPLRRVYGDRAPPVTSRRCSAASPTRANRANPTRTSHRRSVRDGVDSRGDPRVRPANAANANSAASRRIRSDWRMEIGSPRTGIGSPRRRVVLVLVRERRRGTPRAFGAFSGGVARVGGDAVEGDVGGDARGRPEHHRLAPRRRDGVRLANRALRREFDVNLALERGGRRWRETRAGFRRGRGRTRRT